MSVPNPPTVQHTFHVISEDYNFYISIDSDTKPLWSGTTEFGYLTIYRACVSDAELKVLPFIYAIQNGSILGTANQNRSSFIVYDSSTASFESIIRQLVDHIRAECVGIVEAEVEDAKFDGTYQLQ